MGDCRSDGLWDGQVVSDAIGGYLSNELEMKKDVVIMTTVSAPPVQKFEVSSEDGVLVIYVSERKPELVEEVNSLVGQTVDLIVHAAQWRVDVAQHGVKHFLRGIERRL